MVESAKSLVYTGKKHPDLEEQTDWGKPYKPSEELIKAVNITISLKKRPLLLKGEPGCGKTCLAKAVAYELGLPYKPWYIKSTTKAKDGFYSYDAVRRLRDAQLREQQKYNVDDLANYITKGPLYEAFENTKQRTVVLIDEIDKADLDFPNDLLQELDEKRFFIQETGQIITAVQPPIIFITSNNEKDLPDAFLRRCLFHYIEFPKDKQLEDIVQFHFPESPKEYRKKAVERFTRLREQMEKGSGKTGKKVSTSELIDWFKLLLLYPEEFANLERKLPFPEALLKYEKDYQQYIPKEEKK
ncbi:MULTISPECIES: AAA family ATPase [Calothrix]|uniref:MoxR family ATPase n=2 Tax=Calothrix TaxID=1186 RepID=A0ABR8AHA5_9CYAN|nr:MULTISPECIES: MoxR family ATPase [Calothrix]MBD2199427.1 MoxR family ATPase [Calothrix parietina FACHB-288]MBD2228228.1 MoxR family ATPase [Calothrix anomala FACHB-343]